LIVRHNGKELMLQRARERTVLATLLLAANRVVPAGVISETLWADEPPPSASVSVRNYIRRLRQALGEAGERISTHPRGYLIRVGDGELDLARFEQLLASARAAARGGSWGEAGAQAAAALRLWRGEPLADVPSEALELQEAPRLAEMRLQAEELSLEAGLRLGSHDEATAELGRLAAAHPLREHVHALLMMALYRSGRQADALAAYQRVRDRLVEELGAEPGSELQRLHQQILTSDPALDSAPPAAPAGGTGPGSETGSDAGQGAPGGTGPDIGPGPARIPRQLPAAVAQFTGRADELQELAQTLDLTDSGPGTVMISAIGGTAGIGKTALAIHWAHQAAPLFPDGQLYVNLRGFDPGGSPATPAEAIRGFLDALGVPADRIPPDLAAQEGLYRSLLATRRMLVVLDNARDEEQVRPLLPASPGTQVLVTSRRELTALAAATGARLLNLDVLSPAEASQMLASRIGAGRAAAEPEAIAEIARLGACLPLALAVVAARAAARPGFPLAALSEELRDTGGRLDALDTGEPAASVRTVFSWSYQQLTPGGARMFRLLGLHPGPDISLLAASSLANVPRGDARRLLVELTRAQLITEHVPGRYASHDLLRAYAADQARATDSDTARREAIERILDHYLYTGYKAALLLDGTRTVIQLASPLPGVSEERVADHHQATAWFRAEQRVLLDAISLAAETGFDVHAWQISWTMADYLEWRGDWQEWAAIGRTAVAAAARLDDIAAQAVSVRLLARACDRLGDHEQALARLADCLPLCRRLGDQQGEASVHLARSLVSGQMGRYADTLADAQQALRLFQAIGDVSGQGQALNNIGYTCVLLGDYERARESCREALAMCREAGDQRVEAYAWDSLGYAEHHLGNHAQAADCYGRALGIIRERGDRFLEAMILSHLGEVQQDAGDHAAARLSWQQALIILDELHRPDADEIRAKLAAAEGQPAPNPS
jgi:DNA-binding SARP family transcriptional activator/tetratricopeptide (TPR) repeat protein